MTGFGLAVAVELPSKAEERAELVAWGYVETGGSTPIAARLIVEEGGAKVELVVNAEEDTGVKEEVLFVIAPDEEGEGGALMTDPRSDSL